MRVPRRRIVLFLFLIFLLGAGASLLSPRGFTVFASAPRSASGLTIFLSSSFSPLPSPSEAYAAIYHEGRLVYPPAPMWASFPLESGVGSFYVPYRSFVTGNGAYGILVWYGGSEILYSVTIEKWVEYVYLRPFKYPNGTYVIDIQLSKGSGGKPEDRVNAWGFLSLSIVYRGEDGTLRRGCGGTLVETDRQNDFTRIFLSPHHLCQGKGWYSVEATFDNNDARGNLAVTLDPVLSQSTPPLNWFRVD